ncbi:MAG: ABC transporter ATP-binding protein [Acidimicrobiales bacterium]
MTQPVVALENVGRSFDGAAPVIALDGVNLDIAASEHLSIVGPSGSGKSTLLNLLGLLDHPTSGSYVLDGMEVSTLSDRDRTAIRGQWIGFVFQSFHLLSHRSALENVMLAQLYNRSPKRSRRDTALEALDRVGMSHRAGFLPRTLSGGEQQRVAIARALVGEPRLLLCDEPTGNLDQESGESVLSLFEELNREGLTLVVITHDSEVAQRSTRTVRIVDGHMVDV